MNQRVMIIIKRPGLAVALYLLISGSIATGLAQEEPAKLDGKKILDGIVVPQNLRTVCIIHGMQTTTYQHKTAGGFTLQRIESEPVTNPYGINYVQIKNEEGCWQIRPDMAIRLDYKGGQNTNGTGRAALDVKSTYSAQEKTMNGLPCYAVTQVFSDETQARVLQSVSASRPGGARISIQSIPARFIYYIGRDDHLIHGVQTYNSDGRLITDAFYSTVSTNEEFPDSLFEVPAGLGQTITSTKDDYRKIRPYLPPNLIPKSAELHRKTMPAHLFQSLMITLVLLLPLGYFLRGYFAPDNSNRA